MPNTSYDEMFGGCSGYAVGGFMYAPLDAIQFCDVNWGRFLFSPPPSSLDHKTKTACDHVADEGRMRQNQILRSLLLAPQAVLSVLEKKSDCCWGGRS